MGFLGGGVCQIRVESVDDCGLFGMPVSIAVIGAFEPQHVVGRRRMAAVLTMTSMTSTSMTTVIVSELVHDELRNLLKSDFRRFLPAPVGKGGASRLRILKTRNVVTAGAGKLGDRLLADVVEEFGVAVGLRDIEEHSLVTQDRGHFGAQTGGKDIAGPHLWEPFLEVHQRQFLGRCPLCIGERCGRRNIGRLPALGRRQQIGGGVGCRIADASVGLFDRFEKHVRHDRPRVIAGRLAKPAVEPFAAAGVGSNLGADPGEIRAVGARGFGEVAVLVASKASAHLHDLLAPLDIGSRSDAVPRGNIFKRSAGTLEIGDHRADFDRLVTLRFLQAVTGEVFPEAEETWHFGRRAEVLRIPQPRVEPLEAVLRGNVAQAGADLGESARGVGGLELGGERMRARRELGIDAAGGVEFEEFAELVTGLLPVWAGTDILNDPLHPFPESLEPGVGGDRFSDFMVIRGNAHVGPDALVGAGIAIDLVASVAAVLPDEMVALDELWRGRLGESLARLEIDNLMMTLQATRLLEPVREHRENPVVVVSPPMLVVPLMALRGRVGAVGGPHEARGTSLSLMADRTSEGLHRMGAGRSDEEIETRMSGIGLGNATTNRQLKWAAHFRRLNEGCDGCFPSESLASVDAGNHVAGLQPGHSCR